MPEMTEHTDIVELLREKTEEADLKHCLKGTLGGFTRKSVLEYLSLLRERQQNAAEIFDQNLKSLFTEKEKLKSENSVLKEQLLKVQTEYKSLSESLRRQAAQGQDPEPTNPDALRGTIAALEGEVTRLGADNASLMREREELGETVSRLGKNLEQAFTDIKSGEGLLGREKEESQVQRDKVLELLTTIESQRSKIKYLEGQLSEQNVTRLGAEISELSAQLISKKEIISTQTAGLSSRDKTIKTLDMENKMLKLNAGYLSKSLESSSLQNEKLAAANQELAERLKEEYRRAIESIHEKTDITVEKILASKKLEEANSRIASLEYLLAEKSATEAELQVLQKSCG